MDATECRTLAVPYRTVHRILYRNGSVPKSGRGRALNSFPDGGTASAQNAQKHVISRMVCNGWHTQTLTMKCRKTGNLAKT